MAQFLSCSCFLVYGVFYHWSDWYLVWTIDWELGYKNTFSTTSAISHFWKLRL